MKFPLAVVWLICAVAAWGQQEGTSVLDNLITAAEQGNAEAQNSLGLVYGNGRGVPQDDEAAVKWFRRAAEQGHPAAQFKVAVAYFAGRSVPKDNGEVFKWDWLAAEQGLAVAQFCLALLYDVEVGVWRDRVQVYMWLILFESKLSGAETELFDMLERKWLGPDCCPADELTAKNFAEAREDYADQLTAEQIAEAERLAREWRPKTWEELQASVGPSGATHSP